jgi:alpha-tubulin suppressor-like RCC1 family protein
MKSRIRHVPLVLLMVVGGTLGVIACSTSESREAFEAEEADSSASSRPEANLPDAASPLDASPQPVDAGSDGKPPFDPADEVVTCTGTPCAVQLAAGEGHFCARMSDGTVRCWGDNTKGSLGIAATADAGVDPGYAGAGDGGDAGYVVGRVTGLSDAIQLSAGGTTTCTVVSDGGVHCWGGNDKAQLGLRLTPALSDNLAHPTPSVVALPSAATRVDVGQRSACALLTTGAAWCWGDNSQRELARPSPTTVGGPAKAEVGSLAFARTASGTNSGFGVTNAGELFVWGAAAGPEGSVAGRFASLSPDPTPAPIGLGPVTSFAVSSTTIAVTPSGRQGIGHACGIVNGSLHCWGVSLVGAMGSGLPDPVPTPAVARVESETAWPQQVAAAGEITCVRLTDGTVHCAGDNTRGALGRDTTDAFSMFFEPANLFDGHAVQVALAKRTVCALVQGGSVVCWGSNERGELGQGTTDTTPHPTPVAVAF